MDFFFYFQCKWIQRKFSFSKRFFTWLYFNSFSKHILLYTSWRMKQKCRNLFILHKSVIKRNRNLLKSFLLLTSFPINSLHSSLRIFYSSNYILSLDTEWVLNWNFSVASVSEKGNFNPLIIWKDLLNYKWMSSHTINMFSVNN